MSTIDPEIAAVLDPTPEQFQEEIARQGQVAVVNIGYLLSEARHHIRDVERFTLGLREDVSAGRSDKRPNYPLVGGDTIVPFAWRLVEAGRPMYRLLDANTAELLLNTHGPLLHDEMAQRTGPDGRPLQMAYSRPDYGIRRYSSEIKERVEAEYAKRAAPEKTERKAAKNPSVAPPA